MKFIIFLSLNVLTHCIAVFVVIDINTIFITHHILCNHYISNLSVIYLNIKQYIILQYITLKVYKFKSVLLTLKSIVKEKIMILKIVKKKLG